MKKITMFISMVAILFALSPQNSHAQPYTDNFESYTVGGFIAVQNPTWWTTWSALPGSGEDGQISTAFASSGTRSVLIDQVTAPSDLLLKLGNKTSGVWEVKFDFYIQTGKSGYFNILHSLPNPAVWAYEVYFKNDGSGKLYAGSYSIGINFTYPKNTWFQVVNRIDINNDQVEMYVNGALVHTWPFHYTGGSTTGTNTGLAGVNFWAGAQFGDTPLYYFDDLEFMTPPPPPPPVPISNWALFIGIGLIMVFAVVRFRKIV